MSLARSLRYDFLLYLANRVVGHLPCFALRSWFYRAGLKLDIDPSSFIFMGAWFDGRGNFKLGAHSAINQNCHLDNRGPIEIADHVSISSEVYILTADHDVMAEGLPGRVRPVRIGRDVFVGTRAIILPGVTIGEGAAVGAGSVVTKDVEPFTVVAGVPARPIRGAKRPPVTVRGRAYSRWFH